MTGVGAKFANSDPYWRDRKIELDNLALFRKIEYGDLPAYFDTNSMAEQIPIFNGRAPLVSPFTTDS